MHVAGEVRRAGVVGCPRLFAQGRADRRLLKPRSNTKCRKSSVSMSVYRARLVHFRSNLKAQVHSVLTKEGVTVPITDLFASRPAARRDAARRCLPRQSRVPAEPDRAVRPRGRDARGQDRSLHGGDLCYHAVRAIPGVGPVLASIFVAEIGDVSRFTSARHLCSCAGPTPAHHESDGKVRRGHVTEQVGDPSPDLEENSE